MSVRSLVVSSEAVVISKVTDQILLGASSNLALTSGGPEISRGAETKGRYRSIVRGMTGYLNGKDVENRRKGPSEHDVRPMEESIKRGGILRLRTDHPRHGGLLHTTHLEGKILKINRDHEIGLRSYYPRLPGQHSSR